MSRAPGPPSETRTPDARVLAAFGFDRAELTPFAGGLINRSWHVRGSDGRQAVLQAVNPIFPARIHEDIDAVTRHLAANNVPTPQLIPTRDGALWLERGERVWRMMSYVEGTTRDALEHPPQAREAGRLLGRFHRAVSGCDVRFANARLGVHDTAKHLAALRATLASARGHPAHAAVRPLAEEVFALAAALPALPATADRIVHGDPKISNVVFDAGSGRALCLIDLDTLTRMPLPLELGDAMRSWCNPAGEDARQARFTLELFEAAVEGYAAAAGGWIEAPEWQAIPAAALTIAVELAARFCTDALAERYFQWDAARYGSASEHHRARTRGQLVVARDIVRQRAALEEAVERAFA